VTVMVTVTVTPVTHYGCDVWARCLIAHVDTEIHALFYFHKRCVCQRVLRVAPLLLSHEHLEEGPAEVVGCEARGIGGPATHTHTHIHIHIHIPIGPLSEQH
jgi:hypothetical protein